MNELICSRCSEPKKVFEKFCTTCTFMEAEPKKKNRIEVTSAEIDLLNTTEDTKQVISEIASGLQIPEELLT